jgi:hypothetical protein
LIPSLLKRKSRFSRSSLIQNLYSYFIHFFRYHGRSFSGFTILEEGLFHSANHIGYNCNQNVSLDQWPRTAVKSIECINRSIIYQFIYNIFHILFITCLCRITRCNYSCSVPVFGLFRLNLKFPCLLARLTKLYVFYRSLKLLKQIIPWMQ